MKRATISKPRYPLTSTRGGIALGTVIILVGALSIMTASWLRLTMTERKLNQHHFLHLEARAAAEAVADLLSVELLHQWRNQTNFTQAQLNNALSQFNPSLPQFFQGSNVEINSIRFSAKSEALSGPRFLDPDSPSNAHDPQKGKLVYPQEVTVFAKAAAVDEVTGKRVEAYCRQTIQLRDAPLFSHAIFYNMDLEFHPGPIMDMHGPVHSNRDIHAQAVNRIRFHSTLMAAGDLLHGRYGQHEQNGQVLIRNDANQWIDMYWGGNRGHHSSYADSRQLDWRVIATDRWNGNVGTWEHGVPRLRPVGIPDYVPNDWSVPEDTSRNHAYAMIEPQLPNNVSDFKGTNVRGEQFSNKAGVIIRIQRNQNHNPNNPNSQKYSVSPRVYVRSHSNADPHHGGNGLPIEHPLNLTGNSPKKWDDIIEVSENAIYDRRDQRAYDLVEFDVGALREALGHAQNNILRTSWNGIVYVEMPYHSQPDPDRVQLVDPNTGEVIKSGDRIRTADGNVALRLQNGQVLPDGATQVHSSKDSGFTVATNAPVYIMGNYNADGNPNTGSSIVPEPNEVPAAIIGDAITVLSSSWGPHSDIGSWTELTGNANHANGLGRRASFTEVSAAFIGGITPTKLHSGNGSPTLDTSGGVHNFIRFLENWSGTEMRYRGSIVSLYQSEIATGYMVDDRFGRWYSPPNRNWGYNQMFANGIYPPGTPNVRDFRRINFRFLGESDYATDTSALNQHSL